MMINTIIVDNNEVFLDFIKNCVNYTALGFNIVDVAYDADSAIKLLQENPIDLMLTDIRLSYSNGIELAQKARQYKPEIGIIFLKAYDNLPTDMDTIDLGVHSYILKPVKEEVLILKLGKYKRIFDGVNIDPGNPLVGKVITYVDRNFQDPHISLAKIAVELSISIGHVSRLIQKGTGETYTSHLAKLRLSETNRLKAKEGLKTSEAAFRSGFKDMNVFYRTRKRYST